MVDGHTYERPEIEKWLQSSNKSPKTLLPLTSKELTTNFAIRSCIDELVQAKLRQLEDRMDQEVAHACAVVEQAIGDKLGAEDKAKGEGPSDAKCAALERRWSGVEWCLIGCSIYSVSDQQ
jgi:hypothetical protein